LPVELRSGNAMPRTGAELVCGAAECVGPAALDGAAVTVVTIAAGGGASVVSVDVDALLESATGTVDELDAVASALALQAVGDQLGTGAEVVDAAATGLGVAPVPDVDPAWAIPTASATQAPTATAAAPADTIRPTRTRPVCQELQMGLLRSKACGVATPRRAPRPAFGCERAA
jgi:hypothetical protein